jgi:hypothetical protein
MIVNLWRYRSFIARNAVADMRQRYAGSAAGVLWNVLTPLAQGPLAPFLLEAGFMRSGPGFRFVGLGDEPLGDEPESAGAMLGADGDEEPPPDDAP